jgi:hypothetical protein
LSIPYIDLSGEVTETSDAEKSSLRVVGEEVARVGSEVVDDLDSSVKDDGLRRHVYVQSMGESFKQPKDEVQRDSAYNHR